jgi:hypothetical protein
MTHLKAKKQQQKKWKEIRKTATLPMQKKSRLMHVVHNLKDEDRLWLLRECQTQKSKEMLTRTHSEEDGGQWMSSSKTGVSITIKCPS